MFVCFLIAIKVGNLLLGYAFFSRKLKIYKFSNLKALIAHYPLCPTPNLRQ